MSARGEGAGQPSTSAQGQPAAPAPQKRGRGRPRKQQQVSMRAGWGHQPTSAPSAKARPRAAPSAGAGSPRAARRPEGGPRRPRRECAAEPRAPARLRAGGGSRGARRGGGGRWGRARRVRGLSLLCTARRGAGAPGGGERPGAFRAALAIAPGEGGAGGRALWRVRVKGLSPGGRRLFLPPARAARGPRTGAPQPPP